MITLHGTQNQCNTIWAGNFHPYPMLYPDTAWRDLYIAEDRCAQRISAELTAAMNGAEELRKLANSLEGLARQALAERDAYNLRCEELQHAIDKQAIQRKMMEKLHQSRAFQLAQSRENELRLYQALQKSAPDALKALVLYKNINEPDKVMLEWYAINEKLTRAERERDELKAENAALKAQIASLKAPASDGGTAAPAQVAAGEATINLPAEPLKPSWNDKHDLAVLRKYGKIDREGLMDCAGLILVELLQEDPTKRGREWMRVQMAVSNAGGVGQTPAYFGKTDKVTAANVKVGAQ